ncbi:MAG TPA: ABATE domain-containing protein [Methylomirabilota bacterium]|nr:ABATE domain-containing protein [Methylomirabilota bacterium]
MATARGRRESTGFEFPGGLLCLDFVNTIRRRPAADREEQLREAGDVTSWALQAGILRRAEARRLLRRARRVPSERDLHDARAVREAIYAVFSAVAAGRRPDPGALWTLGGAAARAVSRARLAPGGGRFSWQWDGRPDTLDRIVWSVSASAVEFLTSGDLTRVRECAAGGCGRLFLDRSRNRTRQWCDMQVCGNRAKARRHYERLRARRRQPGG